MTWSIGSVTLPYGPESCTESKRDGVKTLVLQGNVSAASKSTLFSTYINPLIALVAKVEVFDIDDDDPIMLITNGATVTVVSPDGRYDGTWVFVDANFREVAEGTNVKRATYILTLQQGSDNVVV